MRTDQQVPDVLENTELDEEERAAVIAERAKKAQDALEVAQARREEVEKKAARALARDSGKAGLHEPWWNSKFRKEGPTLHSSILRFLGSSNLTLKKEWGVETSPFCVRLRSLQ